MARKAKDPDKELAELHAKRVKLAVQRDGLENAGSAAQRVVEEAPDRKRAALVAEARGETPSESVEQVENDRRGAEARIADARERIEALRVVEKEIEAEVDAVVDAHPEHFLRVAVAASEATSEAITAALNATQAAVAAWMETREAWSRVRLSRRRRGLDLGPEVPLDDLGSAVSGLSKAQSLPWPAGSRAAWERFLAHEAAVGTASRFSSNAEAIAHFSGEAA